MVEDLRERMRAAAGEGGDRPPVADLWTRGRSARRHRRLLRVGAVAAVLVVLVGGGIALAARDGDDEGVLAGPPATAAPAPDPSDGGPGAPGPPSEPTDGPGRLTVEGSDEVDGTPVVVPRRPFVVEVEAPGGWTRSRVFEWQVWDGSRWVMTHRVMAASSPSALAIVVPAGVIVPWLSPSVGPGSETLQTPAVVPGWYRVCDSLTGPPEGASSSTEDGEGVALRSVAVCGQARILGEDQATGEPGAEVGPPTDPPLLGDTGKEVAVRAVSSAMGDPGIVRAGASFSIGFDTEAEPGYWTRGVDAAWLRWDGLDWVRTHTLFSAWGDPEVEPTTRRRDADGPFPSARPSIEEPARFVAPPPLEVATGWHLVCIWVASSGRTESGGCVQVWVDASVDDGAVGGPTTTTSG